MCVQGYLYIMLSMGTLAVVYLVHLYYNSRVNAFSRYGNLNVHLRIDLVLCVMSAGLFLGMPTFLGNLFVSCRYRCFRHRQHHHSSMLYPPF